MEEIGAFRVLIRTRLNIEPYSPLKPTKVCFIFIGPNSISRVADLEAVVAELGRRFDLKVQGVPRNMTVCRTT